MRKNIQKDCLNEKQHGMSFSVTIQGSRRQAKVQRKLKTTLGKLLKSDSGKKNNEELQRPNSCAASQMSKFMKGIRESNEERQSIEGTDNFFARNPLFAKVMHSMSTFKQNLQQLHRFGED